MTTWWEEDARKVRNCYECGKLYRACDVLGGRLFPTGPLVPRRSHCSYECFRLFFRRMTGRDHEPLIPPSCSVAPIPPPTPPNPTHMATPVGIPVANPAAMHATTAKPVATDVGKQVAEPVANQVMLYPSCDACDNIFAHEQDGIFYCPYCFNRKARLTRNKGPNDKLGHCLICDHCQGVLAFVENGEKVKRCSMCYRTVQVNLPAGPPHQPL